MAKYAQGYARKNSDTKNLIILFSGIVALIAISVVLVVLYNKFWKKADKTFADEAYSQYVLSDYSKLLDQEKSNGGNYMIYVCTTEEGTSDKNAAQVMKYLDDYSAGKCSVKLYLIDYSKFDSTSDSTETANASAVEAELGFTVNLGYLLYVNDNEILNKSTQVKTEPASVKSALTNAKKNGTWA